MSSASANTPAFRSARTDAPVACNRGPRPQVAAMEQFHGTTIVCVRRRAPDGQWQVAIGGDGQVTLGNVVVKGTARKVRKLYHDKVLAGFAGATADAFTLFERFEAKLEKHQGHLTRAAICGTLGPTNAPVNAIASASGPGFGGGGAASLRAAFGTTRGGGSHDGG